MHRFYQATSTALLLASALGAQIPGVQDPSVQDRGVTTPAAAVEAPASVRNGVMITARIGAVTELHNTMSQTLTGVGLVTGLNGTGSSELATRASLASFIRRHNINVSQSDLTSGSVAMVMVTGELQPFSVEGSRFSVKASITGDSVSLYGGTLVFCELMALDGKVYATASGPVAAGGVAASGDNQSVSRNHPTTGWVADGAQVVRELPWSYFSEAGHLELRLKNPTAHNALSVASGCRTAIEGLGLSVGVANNSIVQIRVPAERRTPEYAMQILARIREVEVPIEHPTRIIIDAGAGIVVAGGGVRISPCAVSLGEMTISVTNDQEISQPFPGFNNGTTERVSRSRVEILESGTEPTQIGGQGATVEDLLKNLRDLSLTPQQMVNLFQTLHTSGYLHADLVVR